VVKLALVAVAATVTTAVAASVRAAVPPFPECKVTNTSSNGSAKPVTTKVWVSTRFIGTTVTLKRGDAVCTNGAGALSWQLAASSSKTVKCTTLANGSLRVFPPSYPNQAVRFKRGRSVCMTNGSGVLQFGVGAAGQLRIADPIVAIDTHPEQGTTVKLAQGFAELTGEGGGRSVVIVGPGQQSFLPAHGNPEQPGRFRLTEREAAAVRTFRAAAPQPRLSRPTAGKSRLLTGIFARGRIGIVVDDRASEQTIDFVKRYFGFLAGVWKLKLDVELAPPDEALLEVSSREFAAFVSPVDVGDRTDLTATPFLQPPGSDDAWQLVLPEDATYVAAMTRFLSDRLFFGRYGDTYRAVYGGEATYDPLRGVLP
jgi:hypothetical protein